MWGVPSMLDNASQVFHLLHQDLSAELGGYIDKLMARRTIDGRDRQDVEQTVWLKVWTSMETVERRPGHGPHDGLRAWVFTVARNTVIDLMKRARYRKHLPLEPDGMIRVNPETRIEPPWETSSASDPHECLLHSETASVLENALQSLTSRQAACIRANIAGYDSVEISRMTNSTSRAVRHAWLRGRRTIREALEREMQCN